MAKGGGTVEDQVAALQKQLSTLTAQLTNTNKTLQKQSQDLLNATQAQQNYADENAALQQAWYDAQAKISQYVDLTNGGPGSLERSKQMDYPPPDDWIDSQRALCLSKSEQQFVQYIPRFNHRTQSFRTHLFFLTSRMRGFPSRPEFFKFALFQSLGVDEMMMCMDYEPSRDDVKFMTSEEYQTVLGNVFEPEAESVAAVEQYKARKQFVKEPAVQYLRHKHELFIRTKKNPDKIEAMGWYTFYHDFIDGLINEKTRWELRTALRSNQIDYKLPKHMESFRNYLRMYEQEMINLFHKGQLSEQEVEGIEVPSMSRINPHTVPDSQQPVVGQQFGLKTINAIRAGKPNMANITCYTCNNKGHFARDCPSKESSVNIVDPSQVAGQSTCGHGPTEMTWTPEMQEDDELNPVVAKIQGRGVSRGRGYSKRGRGYRQGSRRFRLGKSFPRNIPRTRGYRQMYSQDHAGIWFMDEIPDPECSIEEEGEGDPSSNPVNAVQLEVEPLIPEIVQPVPKNESDHFLGPSLLD